MKLFQNPTVAWALALALFITSSASTCASSASPSGLGSTTITSMMGALIPHDKINALIAQAVVAALVSETSSDKATTLLVPTSLPAQGLLGGLPARIEIELDKLEIGGVTMPTLELCSLARNSIGYKGLLVFSEALKTNSTLITLDLEDNLIQPKIVKAFSGTLKNKSTLATLDLTCNLIEDNGTQALGGALRTNSTLTSLYLAGNLIDGSGV
ncbi:MAG: hypothetical protein BYD32DRAFT_461209 [Podila humilis]|nr:MAG: hypothetical protein BYD32DRAFT_461209 [Podila humilis]